MSFSFDDAFGIHQYTLGARAKRAEVLSDNIANADTPGYKARDVDFQTLLSQAQSRTDGALSLTRTDPQHIAGSGSLDVGVMYRVPNQPDTGDGNTVEINQERTAFIQNSIEYQTSLEFLNSKINGLMKALKGDQS